MKGRLLVSLVFIVMGLCFGQIAYANIVTITDAISTATEVDHWYFNLDAASNLILNVLAYEDYGVDFFGNGANNDILDSYIYVFNDVGSLMGSNDDSSAPGWDSDGSVSSLDSYLDLNLSSGNFLLAIGDYYLSQADAWDGVNESNAGNTSLGSYKITLTAANANIGLGVIPEPATFSLLGLGLLGLLRLKRR